MHFSVQLSLILSIALQICFAYDTYDRDMTYRTSQNINFTINFLEDRKDKILVDSTRWINVTIGNDNINDYPFVVQFSIDDSSIAVLIHNDIMMKESQALLHTVRYNSAANNHTFTLKFSGVFIGRTKLRVRILDPDDKLLMMKDSTFPLVVVRQNGMIVDLFLVISGMFVLFINVGFGCSLDVKLILHILQNPIAPMIGVVCQFLLMPLIGYCVTQLFGMRSEFAFGVIVVACAPGGGGSNIWAMLYGGDLDLSLAMTFFSKIIAVGMMPFWMWAFSEVFIGNMAVQIPYDHIALGLFTIALPCSGGIYINKYYPKQSEWLKRAVKPLALLFIIFAVAAGSWVNYFVYSYMFSIWYIIPACMLLPYIGFCLGYFIARLCGQPVKQAATIALETGIQDNGISIILLLATFPSPDGDILATIPVTIAIVTPMPLISAYGLLVLRRRLLHGTTAYSVNADYDVSEEEGAQRSLEGNHNCSSSTLSSASPNTTACTTLSGDTPPPPPPMSLRQHNNKKKSCSDSASCTPDSQPLTCKSPDPSGLGRRESDLKLDSKDTR